MSPLSFTLQVRMDPFQVPASPLSSPAPNEECPSLIDWSDVPAVPRDDQLVLPEPSEVSMHTRAF